MDIQRIITEILKNSGTSQEIIAMYTGLSKNTIRKVMAGKTKRPQHKTYLKIYNLYLALEHGKRATQRESIKEYL